MILLRILKWLKIEHYSDPTYRCWSKVDTRESFARHTAPVRRSFINWQNVDLAILSGAPGRIFVAEPHPAHVEPYMAHFQAQLEHRLRFFGGTVSLEYDPRIDQIIVRLRNIPGHRDLFCTASQESLVRSRHMGVVAETVARSFQNLLRPAADVTRATRHPVIVNTET